jgi:hypothetical protein
MERDTENATVKALKKLGCICPKLYPPNQTGIPDRLILYPNGNAFFVEFKYGKNKLTKHQKNWKRRLKKLGFTVLVAYEKESVIEYAKTQIKELSKADKTVHIRK